MNKEIDKVWKKVWMSQKDVEPSDIFSHRLFLEGYHAMRNHIPMDAMSILEAGGGTGRYGIQIACDHPNSEVLVIDTVRESLELGKTLASRRGAKNIKFEINDMMSFSYVDNQFDCVFSDAVIQVFKNHQDAVNEMARVCKQGGVVIISVCNKWNFHTFYKVMLQILNRPYMYGYEKSFSHLELLECVHNAGLKETAKGGFFVSYGIRRHNKLICRVASKLCDLLVKPLDFISNGYVSNMFGFEIYIVARKPKD